MPRYFHGGAEAITAEAHLHAILDEEERKKVIDATRKAHPISAPARDKVVSSRDGKLMVKRPAAFCQRDMQGNIIQSYEPYEPGSISFGFHGYGYWVVPPGGHVDLDVTIPVDDVKSVAPHLLTEEEWASRQAAKATAAPPLTSEPAKKPADKAKA